MRLSFLRGVDYLYGPISGLSWLECYWLPVQGLFHRSFWVGVGTLWLLCAGCMIYSCACLSCTVGFCQGRVSFHASLGMVGIFWSCICPVCWGMELFDHIYFVIPLWSFCPVCMGRGFVGRTYHGISLWSRLSWISPSRVTSCLCSVCWCVVRVFLGLYYCWVRLSLMIFLFLMRISVCGCGCFPRTSPPFDGVCGVSDPVMLMGSHVFGWCWLLLVCLPCVCICVCSGFVGWVRCFLLWWAGGSSLDLLAFMSFDVDFGLMLICLIGEGSGDGSSSSDVVECSVEMVISAGLASWMNLQLLPLVHFPSR